MILQGVEEYRFRAAKCFSEVNTATPQHIALQTADNCFKEMIQNMIEDSYTFEAELRKRSDWNVENYKADRGQRSKMFSRNRWRELSRHQVERALRNDEGLELTQTESLYMESNTFRVRWKPLRNSIQYY